MLQDDYILRQIREMVRAVMKMLFQVSAVELTPDVIEDTDARQILTNLTDLADNGKIDEAENQLYEMTCDGDRQKLVFCSTTTLMAKTMNFWRPVISAARRS